MNGPNVQTVLGRIHSTELGFVLPHEHLFVDFTLFPGGKTIAGTDGVIRPATHWDIMLAELEAFRQSGGCTIVDVTSRNLGGDPKALQHIAQAAGLHIVAGCGWYRDSFIEDSVLLEAPEQLAEELITEIETGIGDTGIQPGIIGEIGTSHPRLTNKEKRCLTATAYAQHHTGLSITTHAPEAHAGREIVEFLGGAGVSPDRIVVGHCDYAQDVSEHIALAKLGAYLEFDSLRWQGRVDWKKSAAHVATLVERGIANRIMLSHDVCCRSHLRACGGGGYRFLQDAFLPELKSHGIRTSLLRQITVDNPAAVLTVRS